MRVGFVGLDRMGSATAANLLKAGNKVVVWNRSPGKADALEGHEPG
jgi:3-hydroxyisobutyrate dehydrogenase-like beta-hydroxyacid dehydrogenase